MRLTKFVLIVMAGAVSQQALAAATLVATEPANHAMLANAPEGLSLTFSEPVRLSAITMQKHGETAKQSLGPLPIGALDRFVVTAPALTAGGYTVTWRALSEDSNVVSGEFMFMVGSMGQHDMPMNHAEHMEHGQQMPHTMPGVHAMQHEHGSPGGDDTLSQDDEPR